MHLVLVIEPGPARWTVSSPSHGGAARVIDNPLASDDLVTQLKVLRDQASRPIDPDDAHGKLAEQVLVANARALGESLTRLLFSDEQRAMLRDATGTPELGRAGLTVRVTVTHDPAEAPESAARRADSALALPWELVTPTPGEFAVRAARLDVVREAVVPGAVGLTPPERALSVAVLVAAPDGQTALRHEEESWRLLCALHGHDVDFADLGGRDDLLAMLGREVTPTVMHFSGHGLPGALVFEDPYGDAQVVDVAKLTDAMRAVHTRPDAIREMPRLFYLASCHGSDNAPAEPADAHAQPATHESKLFDEAALGRGPSTAAALHRCGFAEVVAYHGPVGDALSTRAEEAFYRALSKGETSLQAVADARRAMCDDVRVEGKARVRHPIAWAQLALYHRGEVHALALPSQKGERTAARFRRREAKVKVQGLPVLEVGFIGRRKHLHEVRRMVERKGRRLVVIQGLGGLGKTALASRLLETVLAHARADAFVFVCKKDERDPAGAMLLAAEEHGRLHALEGWEATCKELGEKHSDTVERFEATLRALRERRPKLVVYADNAELWQHGPSGDDPDALGEWLSEAEPWWAAVERLTDDGVVMLSTRYRWPGLDPESIVAIGAMTEADSLKLIETWDRLGDLPLSVQQELSKAVDGHPRTVEFLNELVKRRQADLGIKLDEYENLWSELVEPVLPAGRKKVSANLLLDDLWKGLSDEARAHASVLRVLRVAAPDDVIRAVGSADGNSTGALRRNGLLTRTAVQVGTGERRSEQDRWSMHPLVVEHVRAHGVGADEVAAHLVVGRAYATRAQRDGATWEDAEEAVHHLHAGKEPNEAWPLAMRLILALRDAALYKMADERLEVCDKAGTSGNARAVMLMLRAQTKALLGDRTMAVLDLLAEAEKHATEERTRGEILSERGSQLQHQGRFADAEAELQRALVILKATVGENHPDYAASLINLTVIVAEQGRAAEGGSLAERALAIMIQTHGEAHPSVAEVLNLQAQLLASLGRPEAADVARRALALLERTLGENHPTTQKVRPRLRAIIDGTTRKPASPGEQEVLTHLNEAHTAMRAQRFTEAVTSFRHALSAARAQSNDRATVAAQLGLAQTLALTGAHDDALTTAREAEAVAARTNDATAMQQARQLVALLARGPSSVRASTVDYNARLQAIDAQANAGSVADARKALTELATQAAADGALVAEAGARGMLAQLLMAEGDHDGAAREAVRALAIAEELGQDDAVTHFRALLAEIDASRGKASPAELVRRLSGIAQRLARKEYNEAFTEVVSVLDAARDAGNRPAEFSARLALSQIQAAVGMKELALAEARKALDIARELRDAEAIAHMQTWIDALT